MTVDLTALLTFGLLSAALHWLIARSTIAKPLWSRAKGWVAALLRCAGCSGFWLGLGLEAVGVRPLAGGRLFVPVLLTGALGAILTPVFEAVLLWGLERSAVTDDEG